MRQNLPILLLLRRGRALEQVVREGLVRGGGDELLPVGGAGDVRRIPERARAPPGGWGVAVAAAQGGGAEGWRSARFVLNARFHLDAQPPARHTRSHCARSSAG